MPTLTGDEVLEVQGTFGGGQPAGPTLRCTTQDIADLGGGGGGVQEVDGTTARITVGGTITEPVIDIAAGYVGQASITTVGTIGTGVWQGTLIGSTYGGTGSAFFGVTGPTTSTKTFTFPDASATVLTDAAAVTVAQGGTGLTTGTSGGIPYFNASSTMASSGALTTNAIIKGGGAGGAPSASGVTLDGSNNATGFGTVASGAHTVTSASATSLVVGPNGTTNPVLAVDSSTGSQAAGLSLTGATAAGTVALAVTSSGSNAGVSLSSKGTGQVAINAGSAGLNITVTGGNISANTVTGMSLALSGTPMFVANGQFAFTSFQNNTASTPRFGMTGSNDTALTASTDAPDVYFNLGQTRTHATGAITIQRDFRITPSTHAAAGASVITDAYSLYIDSAPAAGTNVTITNPWALGAAGKISFTNTDATTGVANLTAVTGTTYMGLNWSATNTTGVRFAATGYAAHSGNGSITSTGHIGGLLGYAQKTGTGTDELVIGVEGRVGATAGTITAAAAVTATFDTDTEDAGVMTTAVGFYLPTQSDSAHITNKYAFLNNNTDWELRTNGASTLFGKITQDQTITPPGTTGAQIINKPTGRVNLAAGATSLVVTNSLVTANTDVYVQQNTIDASMLACYAIATAGSFTIYPVAAPTGEVAVKFWIVN